ncbi:MAG: hypothetical protein DRI69_12030 [Bacteroidetes bacterium]|nr:MAG: hypothetical protein DRI69_12030 [Bacteroidota bacterium]
MDIDLRLLIVKLVSKFKLFLKIRFDQISNTLSYEDQNFEIAFPEEGNRFSISINPEWVCEIIAEINDTYRDQNLLLSAPGYENFIEASSSELEIKKIFGIDH